MASTSLPDSQEEREVYLLVGLEQKLKLGLTICKLSHLPAEREATIASCIQQRDQLLPLPPPHGL